MAAVATHVAALDLEGDKNTHVVDALAELEADPDTQEVDALAELEAGDATEVVSSGLPNTSDPVLAEEKDDEGTPILAESEGCRAGMFSVGWAGVYGNARGWDSSGYWDPVGALYWGGPGGRHFARLYEKA